ncbi:peroxiredoxin family protein [Flavivirga jejuensis]|uniref:Redoxin domain-containing protein n=1 Tax=Flavivirga jejuensis TaxID=870487 RepID=A0ABT8WN35_9FLAO|nr:redoxin domain-containing protein [Flavivirga jejuensis]MDO5974336.1 redoxin domain-containing protein [Flavivirga jejuensis]
MKTSKYILIAFLIFFFGSITVLHIDSKLHEENYKALRIEKAKNREIRDDFYIARDEFRNNKSRENWGKLLEKTKLYFTGNILYVEDYNTACWTIYNNYKKFGSLDALKMVKTWAETAVKLTPQDGHMHDTYANILFELDYVEEAVKHQDTAVKILEREGHGWTDLYRERFNRFKMHLQDSDVKVGDKYIDVTATSFDDKKINFSELIDGQVALINFWRLWDEKINERNKSLLTIYNEFNAKGLIIVGVTKGGSSNVLETIHDMTAKNKQPWVNLLDLEGGDRIWDRYNVINTHYRRLLINKEGVIISINPTEEELKEQLNQLLK